MMGMRQEAAGLGMSPVRKKFREFGDLIGGREAAGGRRFASPESAWGTL